MQLFIRTSTRNKDIPVDTLLSAIQAIRHCHSPATNRLRISDGFLTPGALAVISAFAHAQRLGLDDIEFADDKVREYASALGLAQALWGNDDYPQVRRQEGRNYATLQHLSTPDVTDSATHRINSCLRTFLATDLPPAFVVGLCDIVGDLHENVWAHGRSSGFSMAQKWAVPRTDGNDHYLEFALADAGLGFRSEMRRVGMDVASDREAIEWCIQEGHSTKKIRPISTWAQHLPGDIIGNPLRGVEATRVSDNHHMGLGLYKLTQLINGFGGRLWMASGDSILTVAPGHKNTYIKQTNPWQGVAIACRFQASHIQRAGGVFGAADESVQHIMRILGGRHE